MPDSIKLKHYFSTLKNLSFKENMIPVRSAKGETWVLNSKTPENFPNLTMLYQPQSRIWHLSADVSLPKFLFGHNAQMPNQSEINKGLSLITEYVESKTGLEFDAFSARVNRVDYFRDYDLLTEPRVNQILLRLAEKRLSNKRIINDSTIYYGTESRSKEVCIYSKFRDLMEKYKEPYIREKGKGIIRFESRYKETGTVNYLVKKLKLKDSTAETLLNVNVSNQVMSKVFEDLNFINLLTDDSTNLDRLLKVYSTKRAIRLSGFLDAVTLLGDGFYKDEDHKISRSSYYYNVQLCKKADAWRRSKIP